MKKLKFIKKEKGATALISVFVAILGVVLMAMVIDGGLYYYKAAKLQNAVDAAVVAVSHHIDADKQTQEFYARTYLRENGIDPDKYGNKMNIDIQHKASLNIEELGGTITDEDAYVSSGYVKLHVTVEDSGLFVALSGFKSLKMDKTSYAKASIEYIDMPRALNYTIFGGSTQTSNEFKKMSVQLNGRAGGNDNASLSVILGAFTDLINGINNSIVQPIIKWFGGNANFNRVITPDMSTIVTYGDVHSNSDINIGVQALNVARAKESKMNGNGNCICATLCTSQIRESNCPVCRTGEGYRDCAGDEVTYDDYNQVTYTAVNRIFMSNSTLSSNSFIGQLFNYDNDHNTYVYVQNQQYLEQTQLVLKIINTMDFNSINSQLQLEQAYTTAANKYLDIIKEQRVSTQTKNIVKAQVSNLIFNSKYDYTLRNQKQIVYNVTNGAANKVMTQIYDGIVDPSGENKVTISSLLKDVTDAGYDTISTENPHFNNNSVSNYDRTEVNAGYDITFTKKSGTTAVVHVPDVVVTMRDMYNMSDRGFNVPQSTAGSRFAVARTFVQKSDYIEMPNMRPYFVRQINRSVKNATTTKSSSLDSTTDSSTSVKQATISAYNTLTELSKPSNIVTQFRDKYGNDIPADVNATLLGEKIYKNVVDSNGNRELGLKNGTDFVNEFYENNKGLYGKNAIQTFYQNNIKNKYGSEAINTARTKFRNEKSYTAFNNTLAGSSFANESPNESDVFLRDLSGSLNDTFTNRINNKPSQKADLSNLEGSAGSEVVDITKPNMTKGNIEINKPNPQILTNIDSDSVNGVYAPTVKGMDVLNGTTSVTSIMNATKNRVVSWSHYVDVHTSSLSGFDLINSKATTSNQGNQKLFDWCQYNGNWSGTNASRHCWRPSGFKQIWMSSFEDTKSDGHRALLLYPTADSNGGKDHVFIDKYYTEDGNNNTYITQGTGLCVYGQSKWDTSNNNTAFYTKYSLVFEHNNGGYGNADTASIQPGYLIVNGKAKLGNIEMYNTNPRGVIIVNGDLEIWKATYHFGSQALQSELKICVTGEFKLDDSVNDNFTIPPNWTIIAGSLNCQYNKIINNGTLILNNYNASSMPIENNGTMIVNQNITCASLTNNGTLRVDGILRTIGDLNNTSSLLAGSVQCGGTINQTTANSFLKTTGAIDAVNINGNRGCVRCAGKVTVSNSLATNNSSYFYASALQAANVQQSMNSNIVIENPSGKGNVEITQNYTITSTSASSYTTLYVTKGNMHVAGNFTIRSNSRVFIGKGGDNTAGNLTVDGNLIVDGGYLNVENALSCDSMQTTNAHIHFGNGDVNKNWTNNSGTSVYTDESLEKIAIDNYGTIYAEVPSGSSTIKIVSLYNRSGANFIANGPLEVTGHSALDGYETNSIINSGNLYVNGNLTTEYRIYNDSGKIYVKGSVVAGNNSSLPSGTRAYTSTGTSPQIYVSGTFRSSGTNRSINIDGTGTPVFSVYGKVGVMSQNPIGIGINDFTVASTVANVYLASGISINNSLISQCEVDFSNITTFVNKGKMYCYANMIIPRSITLSGNTNSRTYIFGDLDLGSSTLTINDGHKVKVWGTATMGDLYVNNASEIYGIRALNIGNGKVFRITGAGLVFCGPNTDISNNVSVTINSGSTNYYGALYIPGEGKTYTLYAPTTFKGGIFVTDATVNFTNNTSLNAGEAQNSYRKSVFYVGGTAKLNSYTLDNTASELYLVGNVDITSMSNFFSFRTNSINYIGPVSINGGTRGSISITTYLSWAGTNYVDNSITVNVSKNNCYKDDTDGDNPYAYENINSSKPVKNRWLGIRITDGATHFSGDVTLTTSDLGTRVGAGATLSCQNLSVKSVIYNQGNLVILNNLYYECTGEYSDRKGSKESDMPRGFCIRNGIWELGNRKDRGSAPAVDKNAMMYIGGTNPIQLKGRFDNHGKFYCNASSFKVSGYDGVSYNLFWFNTLPGEQNSNAFATTRYWGRAGVGDKVPDYAPQFSIRTGDNSITHFGGNVETFSSVWTGVDSTFSAENNLSYGQSILNGGKFFIKGSVGYSANRYQISGRNYNNFHVVNAPNAISEDIKGAVSFVNGFIEDDQGIIDSSGARVSHGNSNAMFYCGSGLTFGEYGSNNNETFAGAVENFGAMYVKGDLNVYNKETGNDNLFGLNIIGLCNFVSSKMFVAGRIYDGAGFVSMIDSMTVCDGNLSSLRCARIGANERISSDNDANRRSTAYVYVGGDMRTSTNGRKGSGNLGHNPYMTIAHWNYFMAYGCSNIFVGGEFATNSIVCMKSDVTFISRRNCDVEEYFESGEASRIFVGGDMLVGEKNRWDNLFRPGNIKIMDESKVLVVGSVNSTGAIDLGEHDNNYVKGGNNNNDNNVCSCADHRCSNNNVNGDCPKCSLEGYGACEYTDDTHQLATNALGDDKTDNAYGGLFYIGGALYTNKYNITLYGFSSAVVGRFVYTPRDLDIRSNADLWVLPEVYDNNETYHYVAYTHQSDGSLWGDIKDWIDETIYNFNETFRKDKHGSVYCLRNLYVNKNASLMGTWDCQTGGKCIMKHDSLIFFGHDFVCTRNNKLAEAWDFVAHGGEAGFSGEGGVYTTMTCNNPDAIRDKKHGRYYNIYSANGFNAGTTYYCDKCGAELSRSTLKTNVTCPATLYANNSITIYTIVNMKLTYVVSAGDVKIYNISNVATNMDGNLKQLPNAVASYRGNIDYFAMNGMTCALYYAPMGTVDIDGYKQELWGSIIGDKVQVNAYNFVQHRFSNWKTMQLQIAETGNVFMIPKSQYDAAEDDVDEEYMYTYNPDDEIEGGANLFFPHDYLEQR